MFEKQRTPFELFGFKVKVDVTWLFLAMLVVWSLAGGLFPYWYGGLGRGTYWWMGVAGVLGLFFSIIFHELSPFRCGMPIRPSDQRHHAFHLWRCRRDGR